MSERYDYRPPLGFDIRVRPDKERVRRQPDTRQCQWQGCGAAGTHRAPASPQALNETRWFCLDHVREHNRSWNFFAGMEDDELNRYQREASTGHRPTWKLGERVAGRHGASAQAGRFATSDPFRLFRADAQVTTSRRPRRRLTGAELKAFELFDLDETADARTIKTRYKELVKRFHPDANGGDRRTEDHLRRVLRAYQALKAGGFV